ncbi:17904_t:CDS:2 [Dentiscutata erythropus]|uniref:17904_t:CDS:1 n=1 Tax=Dentiscutata erythropus TaxID=1348616 RepID=A0A9N9DLX5_9GLOM|nr:17904_t:CDS:2 [Dentiscutata erythropus]
MNLVNKTNKCCGCVPLRGGVIFISIFSLVGLTYIVLSDVLSISIDDYGIGTVVDLVISVLFLPVIIFGLFVTCCERKAYLLRVFSILYNVFTVVEIIDSLISIIVIVAYRSPVVSDCYSSNPNVDCDYLYSKLEAQVIFVNVMIIFLMTHFALVIAAYAENRKAKEEKASANIASESNNPPVHKVLDDSSANETPIRSAPAKC